MKFEDQQSRGTAISEEDREALRDLDLITLQAVVRPLTFPLGEMENDRRILSSHDTFTMWSDMTTLF